jgi:hypothetical protein
VGCGSPGSGGVSPGSDDGGASVDGDDAGDDASLIGTRTLVGLAVSPAQTTLVVGSGAQAAQQLQAVGTYSDGSTAPLTSSVTWTRDAPGIGNVDGSGLFTALGTLGGTVAVTASYAGLSAHASILVKLRYDENPGQVPVPVQQALAGATTPDPTVKWAYPYDGTVFPRGLGETTLMWLGGAATDSYYVHVTSATFELNSYATAPQQWFDFTTTAWQELLDSTSGDVEVKVSRWDGTSATTLCDLHWTVGNGSMRGTIYYWALSTGPFATGRVMRIKPGSLTYEDVLGSNVTCPGCHTVSASGKTLVLNEGAWPQETSVVYDFASSSNVFSGLPNPSGASEWALSALSPDGAVVVENFAPLYGTLGVRTGAFDSATGAAVPGTGLDGKQLFMPTFAPDGKLLAYVDATTHDLRAIDWDPVSRRAQNDRLIVPSAANAGAPLIQYPTLSPDHLWIVYQRGSSYGSLGTPGDLYAASVASPGAEIPLDALDGTTYAFAAGDRDRHLNYQPTFAPVAAGGYFWLVFHSRRTWGSKLTQPAYVSKGLGVKQLWVAAFDQSPKAATDPSHVPFYLGGQNPDTLNMRGYWALEPCKADGLGCQSGTECCGGYCDAPDGGAPVCMGQPSSCAQNGDRCALTSDCCNAPQGVTCINAVCSEPPPK